MICPICQYDLGNTWPKYCPKCECALREDISKKSIKRPLAIIIAIAAVFILTIVLVSSDDDTNKDNLNQYGNVYYDGDFANGKLRFLYDDNGSLTFFLDANYREDTIFYKWIIWDLDNNVRLVSETKSITYFEWADPPSGHFEIILRIGADATKMQTFSGTITLR